MSSSSSSTTTPKLPTKATNKYGLSPRVIFFRHGETEWSLSGQHTSITDLPLTDNGVKRVSAAGHALVGPDRLIDLRHIEKVYVSPRKRALQTLDLILKNCSNQPLPIPQLNTIKTEQIREWDYGNYEGLTTKQINENRIKNGIAEKLTSTSSTSSSNDNHNQHPQYKPWSIWRDGCEGGESPQQVMKRMDKLIEEIIQSQKLAISEGRCGDIVLVAHGHILRSFTMRWLNLQLDNDPQISLILEAGGTGVLSYEHHNWNERALNLGGAFTVPSEFL